MDDNKLFSVSLAPKGKSGAEFIFRNNAAG
jgi:hypothetical protein